MTSSAFISPARERAKLLLGEQAVALLRAVEHARDPLLRRLEAVAFEPEDHIRLAGHRPDLDPLLAANDRGGYAAVDRIGQRAIALAQRLDDRCCVHPRAGPERVCTECGV